MLCKGGMYEARRSETILFFFSIIRGYVFFVLVSFKTRYFG